MTKAWREDATFATFLLILQTIHSETITKLISRMLAVFRDIPFLSSPPDGTSGNQFIIDECIVHKLAFWEMISGYAQRCRPPIASTVPTAVTARSDVSSELSSILLSTSSQLV